jgi:Zn-dependent M32 family carboxypeptidase
MLVTLFSLILTSLAGLSGLLEWDEMVMMPEGAASLRGEQKSALAGILHEKSTSDSLGQLLSKLADDKSLGDVQKAVVREAKRRYGASALGDAHCLCEAYCPLFRCHQCCVPFGPFIGACMQETKITSE